MKGIDHFLLKSSVHLWASWIFAWKRAFYLHSGRVVHHLCMYLQCILRKRFFNWCDIYSINTVAIAQLQHTDEKTWLWGAQICTKGGQRIITDSTTPRQLSNQGSRDFDIGYRPPKPKSKLFDDQDDCQGAPLPPDICYHLSFWSLRPLMSLLLTWRKDIMAAETSLWLKKLWSQVTDVKMSNFTKWVSGGHFTVYPKPATAWGGNSSRQPGPKQSLELPVRETWHPALNGSQAHPRGELFVAPDLGVRGRPQSSKKKKLPGRKTNMRASHASEEQRK